MPGASIRLAHASALSIFWMVAALALSGCQSPRKGTASAEAASPSNFGQKITLAELRGRAEKFHDVLTVPEFETSPAQVRAATRRIIAEENTALDGIGRLSADKLTLAGTFGALDRINYEASVAAGKFGVMKDTSPSAALRDAANEAVKKLAAWSVEVDYREDVYHAIQRFAATKPALEGEEARLVTETLRDYRRAGLELPPDAQKRIAGMRKELSALAADFGKNINNTKQEIVFNREELEGVSPSALAGDGIKTRSGRCTLLANVTWQYTLVMENARREATRKKMDTAYYNLARAKNVPLLRRMVFLRNEIALALGYASWADYAIELNMAGTAANAVGFLERLSDGLEPKFQREIAGFRKLKAEETGDPNAVFHTWDWRYYESLFKKRNFAVDEDELAAFFPYEKALEGMFAVYQRIFGIIIRPVDPPYKWVKNLAFYAVLDAATGEPMGLFYLDMFPRDGKYNHFQESPILEGMRLPDGRYQRPTTCLVCNFPAPSAGNPSLLSHDEVEALFHEFGHAMHSILTRATYARFSGTSVPQDFVEAPSQMLENWVWDKRVLDSFASDYRQPERRIPATVLDQLKEARLATMGTYYRRQLSFALFDLAIHGEHPKGVEIDPVRISNDILGRVFLPPPPDTAFAAYFGHLADYDAGYYGYAWADAIAADMATVFENAPDGYFDAAAGRRLRDEIYAQGSARDVSVSIEKFLGRPWSIQPFLKKIGANPGH
jgi:thimet oligopeptidase